MKKFEVGAEYSTSSICDHNCVWSYVVTARTAKTITIQEKGRFDKPGKKCRINAELSEMNGCETVYPMGRYSMAPSLRAE